ncbi:hypothetical protein ACQ4PT_039461 [Festuca glaucescens]
MASGSGSGEGKMASGSGEGKMASSSGEGKGNPAGALYLQYAASYGTGVYDDRQWWPWLVPTLLGACVVVFAVEMYENDCPRHGSTLGGGATCVAGFLRRFSFQPLRENPLLGPSSATVLSALFLRNHNISVGASGALFGLLGSMLSEIFMNWTIYSNKAAAIITLLSIIVINLAIGILPHADNFAHVGGFVTGFLFGFVLLARPQFGWMERNELPETNQPPKYKTYQYVLWGAALLLLLVGYVVSLAMLFKGKNGNDVCHWCRYLNCLPTSRWKCT